MHRFLPKNRRKRCIYFSRESFGVNEIFIKRLKKSFFNLPIAHSKTFLFSKIPLLRRFRAKKTEPQFCIKITVLIWHWRSILIRPKKRCIFQKDYFIVNFSFSQVKTGEQWIKRTITKYNEIKDFYISENLVMLKYFAASPYLL